MDVWKVIGIIVLGLLICFIILGIIAFIGPSNIVNVATGRNISMSYDTERISQYGEGKWVTTPQVGYVLLRVDLTIKNNGYDRFYPGLKGFT